jgi:hypothetical protein
MKLRNWVKGDGWVGLVLWCLTPLSTIFIQCARSYDSWIYNYLCNQCLSPLMLWVRISIRARCTTLCDTVCQWLTTCRWFPPCHTISSTNKTDRHYITEILLKVALNTIKPNQTNHWNYHKAIKKNIYIYACSLHLISAGENFWSTERWKKDVWFGGESRSTQRKPLIRRKSLTNFIT